MKCGLPCRLTHQKFLDGAFLNGQSMRFVTQTRLPLSLPIGLGILGRAFRSRRAGRLGGRGRGGGSARLIGRRAWA